MGERRGSGETREFWRLVIEMQRESGLSVAKFCEREDINSTSFYSWRRKLDEHLIEPADKGAHTSTPRLVPMRVVDDTLNSSGDAALEIVAKNGYVIRVNDRATTEQLRWVLQTVSELH